MNMKCPHCRVECYAVVTEGIWGTDSTGGWVVISCKCPSCGRFSFYLKNGEPEPIDVDAYHRYVTTTGENRFTLKTEKTIMVYPKISSRPPCPPEVPTNIAEDYNEACLVLADSPKASAALSRRCLQNLLREVAKTTAKDLYKQIDEVIDRKELSTQLAEMLDAVRHIGNFAAHPQKSLITDEIIAVEPEEAEWNLDVLEALFDFYCVQPATIAKKKAALNLKLQAVGKHPIK